MAHDQTDAQTLAFVATVNTALRKDWVDELPTFARESVVAVAYDRAGQDLRSVPGLIDPAADATGWCLLFVPPPAVFPVLSRSCRSPRPSTRTERLMRELVAAGRTWDETESVLNDTRRERRPRGRGSRPSARETRG